jgi:hypothetical protein
MNPVELELAISALVTLIQLFTTQLAQAEGLTPEQKQAYLDRITAAQNAIPEWK